MASVETAVQHSLHVAELPIIIGPLALLLRQRVRTVLRLSHPVAGSSHAQYPPSYEGGQSPRVVGAIAHG